MKSVMKATSITHCYLGPAISPEHFVSEHFFLALQKGALTGYDAYQKYELNPGEVCLVRKNHLARYSKHPEQDRFEKVVIVFDEAFLRQFHSKYKLSEAEPDGRYAFIRLQPDPLIAAYLISLKPYYQLGGKIELAFADLKREELLLILLRIQPGLANVLFDFGLPEKADLENFMLRNYTFNVSLERFAYLTGRSLSAFKRDFEKIFQCPPARWLLQKRLETAYFMLSAQQRKASEIYIELGFEDLSHFSYAFKKRFGHSPSSLSSANGNQE